MIVKRSVEVSESFYHYNIFLIYWNSFISQEYYSNFRGSSILLRSLYTTIILTTGHEMWADLNVRCLGAGRQLMSSGGMNIVIGNPGCQVVNT